MTLSTANPEFFIEEHIRPAVPVKDDAQTHSQSAAPMEDTVPTYERPAAAAIEDDTSYERWDPDAQEFLLEWLEMPGNYALYRGSGPRKKIDVAVSNGSTKVSEKSKAWKTSNDSSIETSWKTKAQVLHCISEFLRSKDVIKTPAQIGNKVKYFISSYRKAADYLRKTGQLGAEALPQKVLSMCPLFRRLDAFMCPRVPPISLNTRTSSIPPLMPTSLGESIGTVTADVVTSATASTASEGLRGLTEAIRSLGEQNRRYGEQKLALRAEWQSKQFEVLHRKLDLQQQEISLRLKELDSRNLKMELQIERLRAKRRKKGASSASTQDDDCDSD